MGEQSAVQQIFVYGTLMSRFDNPMAFVLDSHCQLVGNGTLPGTLYDTGDYPVAIYDKDAESTIKGEIHLIHPEKLPQVMSLLDKYEGYIENNENSSLYLRKVLPVKAEEGHDLSCWVYIYNRPINGFPLIEEGNYIKHLKSQGRNLY